MTAGEQGPGNTTIMYDLVFVSQAHEHLEYVCQYVVGSSTGGSNPLFMPGSWYGIANYLTYEFSPRWSGGVRLEWFRDDDGTRVSGRGVNNNNVGQFDGDFFEVTLGVNWTPWDNFRVRPEVRWDWFDGTNISGNGPYDGLGDQDFQFMAGVDFILLL